MDINKMNEITIPSTDHRSEKGVTTVEYAVMLVLVAIAVLAFGSGIANSVTGVFSTLASSLG
jgi:Flp pilus assembly pilin Flp